MLKLTIWYTLKKKALFIYYFYSIEEKEVKTKKGQKFVFRTLPKTN